ncbi:MAG: hypothetical protein LUG58_02800, partial [Clostridiales bacterium]|nr:hypothetical protein [Clostridiales bacterium]
PFVSVGGSSMMSCWALLAFIKASDTRQNAGLAVRLPRRRKKIDQEDEPDSWRAATGFFRRGAPSAADENAQTVGRRPDADDEPTRINRPAALSPAPKPSAPSAEDNSADFPNLDFSDETGEATADADDWRSYFLKDDEWEDKP